MLKRQIFNKETFDNIISGKQTTFERNATTDPHFDFVLMYENKAIFYNLQNSGDGMVVSKLKVNDTVVFGTKDNFNTDNKLQITKIGFNRKENNFVYTFKLVK